MDILCIAPKRRKLCIQARRSNERQREKDRELTNAESATPSTAFCQGDYTLCVLRPADCFWSNERSRKMLPQAWWCRFLTQTGHETHHLAASASFAFSHCPLWSPKLFCFLLFHVVADFFKSVYSSFTFLASPYWTFDPYDRVQRTSEVSNWARSISLCQIQEGDLPARQQVSITGTFFTEEVNAELAANVLSSISVGPSVQFGMSTKRRQREGLKRDRRKANSCTQTRQYTSQRIGQGGHFRRWIVLEMIRPTLTKPEATPGDRIDLRISGQPEELEREAGDITSHAQLDETSLEVSKQIDSGQRFGQELFTEECRKRQWLSCITSRFRNSCWTKQSLGTTWSFKGRKSCCMLHMVEIWKTRRDIFVFGWSMARHLLYSGRWAWLWMPEENWR